MQKETSLTGKLSGFLRMMKKYNKFLLLLLVIALLIFPNLGFKPSAIRIMVRILLYATLAGALNMINGYSGQTCIGFAGFFSVGSFITAIMSTRFEAFPYPVLMLLSGIGAALFGAMVALPTLKLKGVYLSFVTIGASELIRIVAYNWTDLTGGAFGIKNIPAPSILGFEINKPIRYYYFCLLVLIVFLFISNRVLKSRVGRAWMSIREDQLASKSLGISTSKYKVINFCYGAFWAGVCGAMYAPYLRYIDSSIFDMDECFNILSMVIIGGQATLVGPILGAALVTLLTEALRFLNEWRFVLYAILIIAMMWWRPQGIAGASDSILAGKTGRRRKKTKRVPTRGLRNG